jgi:hypothetical protein
MSAPDTCTEEFTALVDGEQRVVARLDPVLLEVLADDELRTIANLFSRLLERFVKRVPGRVA